MVADLRQRVGQPLGTVVADTQNLEILRAIGKLLGVPSVARVPCVADPGIPTRTMMGTAALAVF